MLPLVHAPDPTPAWLLPDEGDFFQPSDHLVVGLLIRHDAEIEDKIEACRQFFRIHGEGPLLDAIDAAGRVAKLDPRLRDVADRLRRGKAVAA